MFNKSLIFLLALTFLLSACAPAAPAQEAMMEKPAEAEMAEATEAMMEKPAETMMEKTHEPMAETPAGEMMEKTTATPQPMDEAMMEAPAWFSAPLTDVRSGANFAIQDFKGKVVMVETMAIWCSSCKRQQEQVKAFHQALGMNKDLATIALDIDPNENGEDLKAYADRNGFDWTYAVAPAEVARELAQLYGDQFLNPPSTPIVVIDRHGEAHPLPFGVKSAEDLMAFLAPFLQEDM
ncbi:MAG: TlpA family protein disulfide reductase [Chloroflexi bacterium]|nr:TlpA family protein disulfide reductase [Chloroflexota bacterium]